MKRFAPVLLSALAACVGPERRDCDTSGFCDTDTADTEVGDADTDSDTDSDTDTDPPEPFDPYAFFVEWNAGYDGSGLVPYGLDQNDPDLLQDPFIVFTIVERQYFDSGSATYTCRWTGKMDPVAPTALQGAWEAWDIQLTLISTTCDGFPTRDWDESTPTTKLEQLDVKLGFGEMSGPMKMGLRQAVEESGEDWYADWEPYVFSGYLDFGDGSKEGTYTFAQQLEADLTPVYDEGNNAVYVEMNRATGLAPLTHNQANPWDAWMVSPLHQ